MKILIISIVLLLGIVDDTAINPGEEPDCETFDNLTAGDFLSIELPNWTTWGNNPGTPEDVLVTDTVSYSPLNSFIVEGTSDLINIFGSQNFTSGKYYYSNRIYIPEGFCGYFNLQKDVVPGVEFGFQVHFDFNGTASCDAGGGGAGVFNFTFEEWHQNEIYIDLNNDIAEYLFDGELIVTWPWSLGTFGISGVMTLGSTNYYAWKSSGNSPKAYFDDICFEILDPLGINGSPIIENVSTTNIYPNPVRDRIIIESKSIIDKVSLYNNMGQLVYSGQFDNSQIIVNTSSFNSGVYIVQINSNEAVEVRKLIIE